ncbi:MAG TPA: CbiQ family ECF transporter T component, partial [Ilumatobacteraceae bacterium]|nr:CbiQ family ECF transporter T component [Ilumatobacteraceae bacterium]
GVAVVRPGLWAAWNLAAKVVLGATASIVLTATTTVADVLRGLTALRVPRVLVAIIAMAFRSLDILVDRLGTMR